MCWYGFFSARCTPRSFPRMRVPAARFEFRSERKRNPRLRSSREEALGFLVGSRRSNVHVRRRASRTFRISVRTLAIPERQKDAVSFDAYEVIEAERIPSFAGCLRFVLNRKHRASFSRSFFYARRRDRKRRASMDTRSIGSHNTLASAHVAISKGTRLVVFPTSRSHERDASQERAVESSTCAVRATNALLLPLGCTRCIQPYPPLRFSMGSIPFSNGSPNPNDRGFEPESVPFGNETFRMSDEDPREERRGRKNKKTIRFETFLLRKTAFRRTSSRLRKQDALDHASFRAFLRTR